MDNRDCFIGEEELNIYLDGELGVSRKEALDQHLKSCRICSLRYEIASELKSKLRVAASADRAPDWLKYRIKARLEEGSRLGTSGFWGFLMHLLGTRPLIPVGAAGVLVIAFLMAIFISPTRNETAPLVTDMVQEHYEYLEGPPPDGIMSDNLHEINQWIATNAGIDFALSSERGLPSLRGACAILDHEDTIGWVGFNYLEKKVSLFMTKGRKEELFGQRNRSLHDFLVYSGEYTDVSYALWHHEGITCVLVGDLPEERLIELADLII